MAACPTLRAARRVVLIAATVPEGRAWLAQQPSAPTDVVIVTPRSPHAARGIMASAVLATPAARAHSRYGRLLAESLPAVQGRL